jgi:hypothetical protein
MNRGQESAHHDVTLHRSFDAIASIFHEPPAKKIENIIIIEREKKMFGFRNDGLRKREEGGWGSYVWRRVGGENVPHSRRIRGRVEEGKEDTA